MISSKIKSYVHDEYDIQEFTNLQNIKKKIENFIDPFNRNKKLKKVRLDDKYPKYITENVKRFADIIS